MNAICGGNKNDANPNQSTPNPQRLMEIRLEKNKTTIFLKKNWIYKGSLSNLGENSQKKLCQITILSTKEKLLK